MTAQQISLIPDNCASSYSSQFGAPPACSCGTPSEFASVWSLGSRWDHRYDIMPNCTWVLLLHVHYLHLSTPVLEYCYLLPQYWTEPKSPWLWSLILFSVFSTSTGGTCTTLSVLRRTTLCELLCQQNVAKMIVSDKNTTTSIIRIEHDHWLHD